MKNLFSNSNGFSLIQGMIIAAVVAGSALVATRLLGDQKLAQKGAETRDLVEELHNTLFTVLQGRENCRSTMVANGLQGTLGASVTSHNLTTINTHNSTPPNTPIL